MRKKKNKLSNELINIKCVSSFSHVECVNCVDEPQLTNRWTMPLHKIGDKKYYIGTFFKVRTKLKFKKKKKVENLLRMQMKHIGCVCVCVPEDMNRLDGQKKKKCFQ